MLVDLNVLMNRLPAVSVCSTLKRSPQGFINMTCSLYRNLSSVYFRWDFKPIGSAKGMTLMETFTATVDYTLINPRACRTAGTD